MKDLCRLIVKATKQLERIEIYCNTPNIRFQVNDRFKATWGRCHLDDDGGYTISISARLMDDNCSDRATLETIIHELLHTIAWEDGHSGEWKILADEVNKRYGYNITRTSSEKKKGLLERERNYKYSCQCDKCGIVIRRTRMSNLIKFPQFYTHLGCTGHFKRIS